MSQLLVRPAAAADIEEAYLWYEKQRTGLGEEFLDAVDSLLNNIVAHPTAYPIIHREARRARNLASQASAQNWTRAKNTLKPSRTSLEPGRIGRADLGTDRTRG